MTDLIIRPHFLWLLCVLPLLLFAMRRSLAGLERGAMWVCLTVRCLILSLLVLALAGVRYPWRSEDVAVAFALDRSASISPEAEKAGRAYVTAAMTGRRHGDNAALYGFAGRVVPLDLTGVGLEREARGPVSGARTPWPAQPERNATDLSKALAFAAAMFPEGKTKRLVLLSDGNDTAGHAAEAAQALRASGVELCTVPLRNPFRPEVLVERLDVPPVLHEGEPFNAVVVLRSNVETGCAVRLFANGFIAGEQSVKLKPGGTAVTFLSLHPEKGRSTYSVEISPEQDTLAENNRALATTLERGEPAVLIVDPAPDKMQALVGALKAAHIAATVRPPEGLPATMEDLQAFDVLILSDVSAVKADGSGQLLTVAQMKLYSDWVHEFGGGFAMLGGEKSFGLGGYFGTPIEKMLPVRMDHNDVSESPVVAVMIILDRSGSMSEPIAGQTKIALANQGAALALDVLQPKDLLGVMAVDTRVHQVATLSRHDNKSEVVTQIKRVTAGGGGIYIYTSLVDAFSQLRDANAKIKHVILFSDAGDAEEKAAGEVPDGSQVPGNAMDLVTSMAAVHITTSVVGLGGSGDKDVAYLKQLADAGGGQFYLTDDALALPQIFTTETMRVAQSSLAEEPFLVRTVHKSPILDGIEWDKAPPLGGCNLTKSQAGADLLLTTERGDPVLAMWRFGAGQVAAFTSDAKSRWASDWFTWPGFGKFWAQLTRSLVRSRNASGFDVRTVQEGDRLHVRIDAIAPDGSFRNQLPITVGALEPGGATRQAEARQVAPGRYQAEAAVSGTGTTWIAVRSSALPDSETILGYTPPYPAEFLSTDTDEPALRRLAETAGGRFDPKPETIFERPAVGVRCTTDLSEPMLALALLLLPLDVWLRRR